jgi:hypothetical protein
MGRLGFHRNVQSSMEHGKGELVEWFGREHQRQGVQCFRYGIDLECRAHERRCASSASPCLLGFESG